jgi:hypothetical protein
MSISLLLQLTKQYLFSGKCLAHITLPCMHFLSPSHPGPKALRCGLYDLQFQMRISEAYVRQTETLKATEGRPWPLKQKSHGAPSEARRGTDFSFSKLFQVKPRKAPSRRTGRDEGITTALTLILTMFGAFPFATLPLFS